MSIGFFKMLRLCPECGGTLKRIGVKCENGSWIKVWGCQCCPTVEEVAVWEGEVELLERAMSQGSVGQA